METPDLSTLSDNIDTTDDLLPSLQVFDPWYPLQFENDVVLRFV